MKRLQLGLLHCLLAYGLCLMPFSVQAEDNSGQNTLPPKIAVVDFASLMEKSPQSALMAKEIKDKYEATERQLDAENSALQQAQNDLKQRIQNASIGEDDREQAERDLRSRERTYRRSIEDFRDEVNSDRSQALERLQSTILQAIEEVRAQKGIDIVFRENAYVVASDRIDITSIVLEYLTAHQNVTSSTAPPVTKPQE